MSIYVIADACCNHLGELRLAKELVRAAKEAGADAIKFQTYNLPEINDQALHPFLASAALTEEQLIELKHLARAVGIDFISSAFDKTSIDTLMRVGVRAIKVPSGELHNLPYLRYLALSGVQLIILSTGMSGIEGVKQAIHAIWDHNPAANLWVLHCVTAYPCPIDEANVSVIKRILNASESVRIKCKVPQLAQIGFSDHTESSIAAVMAIAYGARVIEKHFSLNPFTVTPDSPVSLDPIRMAKYIRNCRDAEKAIGSGIKQILPCEEKMLFRRHIVGYNKG